MYHLPSLRHLRKTVSLLSEQHFCDLHKRARLSRNGTVAPYMTLTVANCAHSALSAGGSVRRILGVALTTVNAVDEVRRGVCCEEGAIRSDAR